jgi:hypothetical protein
LASAAVIIPNFAATIGKVLETPCIPLANIVKILTKEVVVCNNFSPSERFSLFQILLNLGTIEIAVANWPKEPIKFTTILTVLTFDNSSFTL